MDDDLAASLIALEELIADPEEVLGMLTFERDATSDARVNKEIISCFIG